MQMNIDPAYLASQGLSLTFPARFICKVQITDHHWFWTGSTRPCSKRWPKGHGMIQRSEGVNCKIYAHRASWILFRGPIPDDKMVLHICPGGTCPHCVNPDHLELGDGFKNMQQMTDEGSNHFSTHKYGCKGESHWKSKLTWEIVREIRYRKISENLTGRQLSEIYNISEGSISMILRNIAWVEIAAEPSSAPQQIN